MLAAIGMAGGVGLALAPASAPVVAFACFFVIGIGMGGVNTLMWALEADTVEYGEWKTGVRTEGITYALFSFTRKQGQAIGARPRRTRSASAAISPTRRASPTRRSPRSGSRQAPSGRRDGHRDGDHVGVPPDREPVPRDRARGRPAPGEARGGGGRISRESGVCERIVTALVVTLFESFGSGAEYIGPRVAAALGVPFHAGAFSSQEIEDAMTRREAKGVLSRVFGAMGGKYAAYGGLEGGSVPDAQRDNYEVVMENTREVVKSAQQGGVIMGRNGALILADWPGALHVKLDGPLQARLERVAETSGISLEQAARRQKQEDQVRADISLELYGWNPQEFDHYDLLVNTGLMDLDVCVDIIVATAKSGPGPGLPRRRRRPPPPVNSRPSGRREPRATLAVVERATDARTGADAAAIETEMLAVLEGVQRGEISLTDALTRIGEVPFRDLGFARVDTHRELRQAAPGGDLAEGKTPDEIEAIARALVESDAGSVLVTRADAAARAALRRVAPDAEVDARARLAWVAQARCRPRAGWWTIVSGGTWDGPVVTEARVRAELLGTRCRSRTGSGSRVCTGSRRRLRTCAGRTAWLVVAGQDAALASVVGGLVGAPVIGVPTSTGYGAALSAAGDRAALDADLLRGGAGGRQHRPLPVSLFIQFILPIKSNYLERFP